MELIHAVLLGIVEGMTEFLPISSTFHLQIASRFLGMPASEFVDFFVVFIQAWAILPVLYIFHKEWFGDLEFLKKVVLSFIPTALLGVILYKPIKEFFFDAEMVKLAAFALVGLAFLLVEFLVKKKIITLTKDNASITYLQAVMIGVFQACAFVPGVSRAGAVMVGMMLLGYRRDEAAKYSFTLAVPTILAAAGLDLIKSREVITTLGSDAVVPLLLGSFVSAVTAFIILRWFIQFLRQNTLKVFGVYRLILAGVLIIMGYWR